MLFSSRETRKETAEKENTEKSGLLAEKPARTGGSRLPQNAPRMTRKGNIRRLRRHGEARRKRTIGDELKGARNEPGHRVKPRHPKAAAPTDDKPLHAYVREESSRSPRKIH
jgi:hypothetical protein